MDRYQRDLALAPFKIALYLGGIHVVLTLTMRWFHWSVASAITVAVALPLLHYLTPECNKRRP